MLKSLLWKEWRETAWKIAFGCTLLLGYAAIGLSTRVLPDELILISAALFGSLPLPIFIAIGLFEKTEGRQQRNLLLALPVQSRRIVAVKLLAGSVSVLLPFVALALLFLGMAGDREMPAAQVLIACSGAGGLAVTVLFWTAALGVRAASDTGAVMAGLCAMVFWYLEFEILLLFNLEASHWAYYLNPFFFWLYSPRHGFSFLADPRLPWLGPFQALMLLALWAWMVKRFPATRRIKS